MRWLFRRRPGPSEGELKIWELRFRKMAEEVKDEARRDLRFFVEDWHNRADKVAVHARHNHTANLREHFVKEATAAGLHPDFDAIEQQVRYIVDGPAEKPPDYSAQVPPA